LGKDPKDRWEPQYSTKKMYGSKKAILKWASYERDDEISAYIQSILTVQTYIN